jgi:hypothetical protein
MGGVAGMPFGGAGITPQQQELINAQFAQTSGVRANLGGQFGKPPAQQKNPQQPQQQLRGAIGGANNRNKNKAGRPTADQTRVSREQYTTKVAQAPAPVPAAVVPSKPVPPEEQARLRLPMHSILYNPEEPEDNAGADEAWNNPDALPENHYRRPTDVRFRPNMRDDFVTYWQEKGGEWRAQPDNMYRHVKMEKRLEEMRDSITKHHDSLVTARKQMTKFHTDPLCSEEDKLSIKDINRHYETTIPSSKTCQQKIISSFEEFKKLVKVHAPGVLAMADKKVNGTRAKRKRAEEAE